MSYVTLTPADIALAAILLLVNAAISIAFRLGQERALTIALARMIVQLVLAGLVLKIVFQQGSLWVTALAALVMVLAAGWEAQARQRRKLAGYAAFAAGSGTLLFVGVLIAGFAVLAVIKPTPWDSPRYLLPILGMILGNALTGVALVLDAMTASAHRDRAAIEAQLTLGANRYDAMRSTMRDALRVGMMPIINAMAATGLVALPGMMTGQILAGVDPLDAAKYQIVIMCLIGAGSALASVATALWSVLLLTDERHRLRLDRLKAEKA